MNPTLKGLNRLKRSAYALCSTPSGSGLLDLTSPGWRGPRHPGLLMLVPFGDSPATASTPGVQQKMWDMLRSVGGGEGLGEGAFEVIRVGFLEITEKQSQ